MSGGSACQCAEAKKPVKERNWVVTQRKCNHSAFNGYHYTPSDYSSIKCLECGAIWRTKATYVSKLRDPRGPILWVQETGKWTDEAQEG